jgi:tRNA(Arg) A34 adenosine deaminase TadA
MNLQKQEQLIRRTFEIAIQARKNGNHPFGALLADQEGNILLEAENTVVTERDVTGHAETNLVRLASKKYEEDFLQNTILFTSTEPCPMCCGAIHWSGIRTMVFGLPEDHLYKISGDDPEIPSVNLPSREFFTRTKHPVEITGPLLEEEAAAVHKGFWHPVK